MVNKCTSHSHICVALRHRSNSEQQLHEVINTRRPTCLLFETMLNGDNYFHDGLLMPPERPWIDNCMAASCLPQLISHNGHIRRHSSCLIYTLPMPKADDDVGGCGDKTEAGPASCMPTTHVAWPPPPGNLGYGWSSHASVDRYLDSPHAAASLLYHSRGILPPSSD